jgi:acyl-CoA reductase-like NAD-dependent aldehyde dehydrogenase
MIETILDRVARQTAPLLIRGKLCLASSGESFSTYNPATNRELGCVALASPADVDAAVRAARDAIDAGVWSRAPVAHRKKVLLQIADRIEAHREELALLESLDTGVPIAQTGGRHLARTISNFRYFAELPGHATGELVQSEDTHLNLIVREAVGVIGVLSPWNAPLALSSMRIAAALAFGNSVVVKPAEQAPLTASRLAEIVAETDLPAGVWNLVQGPGLPTGAALAEHPGVDAIALTGGTATGKAVMRAASASLKKLSLELGGKSANVIFSDADWERALDGALIGIFSNNGQQCLAGSRILVEANIYDRFIEAFVARANHIRLGDPLDPATEVGPLVTETHYQRVMRFIETGRAEGATLHAGGERPAHLPEGNYLRPTVFGENLSATCLSREEIFGPVATFKRFETEGDAIALANDSAFGLAGYVWTRDLERAHRVSSRMRAGTVWVNTPLHRDIRAPFGGIKDSGFGSDGGPYGLEFYTNLKNICVALRAPQMPKLGFGS